MDSFLIREKAQFVTDSLLTADDERVKLLFIQQNDYVFFVSTTSGFDLMIPASGIIRVLKPHTSKEGQK